MPSAKASNEFTINTRKGTCFLHGVETLAVVLTAAKKNDKLTFSSDYRLEILTEVLVCSVLCVYVCFVKLY